MRKLTKILLIAVVVVLAVVGATAVFAQTTPDRADAETRGVHEGGRRRLGQLIDKTGIKTAVAEALGLTVAELDAAKEAGQRLPELAEAQGVTLEDVQAAMEAAFATAVQEAIDAGTVTAEEGERLLERGFRGGKHGHRGGPRGMNPIFDREAMETAVADALGMTVAELQAAKEAHTPLPELLEAQGVSPADFQAAIEAARTAAIEQAVADGTITQEQADEMLSHDCHFGKRHRDGSGRRDAGRDGDEAGFRGGFQRQAPQGVDQNA